MTAVNIASCLGLDFIELRSETKRTRWLLKTERPRLVCLYWLYNIHSLPKSCDLSPNYQRSDTPPSAADVDMPFMLLVLFSLCMWLISCTKYKHTHSSAAFESTRPLLNYSTRKLATPIFLLSTISHRLRFLPRDALLSAVYAVVVCLCVCHTPVLYQNG